MPNIVETVFSSKDTGMVETIDRINSKLPEIVRSAQAAGAGVDTLELKMRRLAAIAANHNVEISKADYAALRAKGIPAIDATIEKIQRATDAQRAQTRETERTAEANRKVDQAVARIRAQEQRTAQIGRESSLTDRAPQFAAPSAAAASALERTTQGFGKATEGAQKLQKGSAELRQTLFSLSGVPYPEAANQLSKLLGGSLGGALAIAGITAIGAAAVEVSQQIREQAEADLKRIQAAANFGKIGGLESRGEALDRLTKIRQAAIEAQAAGQDPNRVVGKELGTVIPENAIKKGAREAAELFTSVFAGDVAAKVFATPPEVRVGTKSFKELEQEILAISQAKLQIEERLGIAQQRRLEKAREERKIQESVIDSINSIFGAYQKESEDAEKARQRTSEGAQSAIEQLERQLQTNPIVRAIDDADVRINQFKKQFPDVGDSLVQAFEEANERIKNLDIFKGKLLVASQIGDTLTEKAKLEAGLGGQGLRDAATRNQADRAAILKEIEERRGAGSLTGAQQDALLAKLNNIGTQLPAQRVQQEAVDRGIAIANAALASATTAEQKRLAIESGLGATRDIGNLTSSQIDARAKLLDQSLAIQQDLLREQREREDRLQASQERFATALNDFSERFGESVGILSGATDQLKDGVNLNISATDDVSINLGSVDPNADFNQGRIANTTRRGTGLSENF